MELTPELYNAIKTSLSDNEKIVFIYPGIDGVHRYESLDDVPLDISGGDAVVMIIEYLHPTAHHTMKRMWGEFVIDISKFSKTQIQNIVK